ncbi:hypothetical protein IGS67_06785 [Flavimobilis sp. GY10621]|uniref:DUF6318 domain-containing protein n=1 Tax=Flavimobilis rhizosphaerae TaxID=2775421 RepID=A0ABR9DQ02_9MICO|nr:DUF6318 family protein [Flavimobilis rhizosphaerae]MBD9699197.1 hypothetical protein [Flavimobilis rhizosphaerae]
MPAARPARALTMSAALAATVLTVAACTGGTPTPVPTTLATPAPTTTAPTPSPTQTEDPNPAGLKPLPADEIDASFVTIENFFRAYEYALTSGDTAPLDALSTQSCKFCSGMGEDFRKFYAADASMTGGKFTIHEARLLPSDGQERLVWRLDVKQSSIESLMPDGETVTDAGFRGPLLVEVTTRSPLKISGVDTKPEK